MNLQVSKRGFPHDDTAVFLPGAVPKGLAVLQEVSFSKDTLYADGVQGLFAKTKTEPGLSAITVIGPTASGEQKVFTDYEVGKFFAQ